MADSNVLMPPDYIRRLFSRWTAGSGLVASPAAGIRPKGFWAELECAFLNTYQARWQLAADQLGFGSPRARRALAAQHPRERRRDRRVGGGGGRGFAATNIVHRAGLKVRLAGMPFPQPLGFRSLAEVWRRQLRWARLRRVGLKAYFIPELLTGGPFPTVRGRGGRGRRRSPLYRVVALFLAWYGAEFLLARSRRMAGVDALHSCLDSA